MIEEGNIRTIEEMKRNGEYKVEYQGGYSSPIRDAREFKAQPLEKNNWSEESGKSIARLINQGTKDIMLDRDKSVDEALSYGETLRKINEQLKQ